MGPLAGLKVIELASIGPGPMCAMLLADLGAEVIKIEHPKYGDGQRKLEPIMNGIPLWWKSVSRNKRCITLDLGKPEKISGDKLKQTIKVRNGIESTLAKKMVGLIKESKLKVQAQIMEDQVRVSGKQIDDLQEVIQLLKGHDFGIELQFVNIRS